ncbi:probable palmitoyltransferase ZDHHC12 [Camellia sinensis]|uniref:probable palmitoyltransferase ZDHHC12 n=1 Tax=Camellia sinensis TaxID=4442 RepID=UPI001036142C|nr:probable palmitoyltransferase ZDHHC12 [Camellia sinensis]
MLQETCRSGRISAGFRFLQYYIQLGRLYWIGSTRSLFFLIISPLLDVILNAEFFMLVIGLCSILTTDPGYVTNESSHHNQLVESPVSVFEAHSEELVPSTHDIPYEFVAEESSVFMLSQNSIPLQRVRYCRHCKAYVKGFDHHCPSFGNCIGQKNHVLFIILLFGFVFTEASYVECSSQCKLEYIGY